MEIRSSAVWEVSRAEGMGWGLEVGGVAATAPGAPSSKLALQLASPPTVPGLASPKEGSLSIAPNHSGEPGPVILPPPRHAWFSWLPVHVGADCEDHGRLPGHG